MKLTGNIVQQIAGAIARLTDTTPEYAIDAEPEINEFRSLVGSRQESKVNQNDNNDDEPEMPPQPGQFAPPPSSINYNLAPTVSSAFGAAEAAGDSEDLLENLRRARTTSAIIPTEKLISVRSQAPTEKVGAESVQIRLNDFELQSKAVSELAQSRVNNLPPVLNPAPRLTLETATTIAAPGRVVENQLQAGGEQKEQFQKPLVVGLRDKISPIQIMEQKTTPALPVSILTNTITQNIYSPPAPGIAPTSLAMVAQGLPSFVQTIEVQLVPRNLGIVEVKIIRGRGRLDIAIETKTQSAESLLRAELAAISKSLSAAGLSLDEITVKYNPRLEQLDPRESRIVGAPTDKPGFDNFNSSKNQQSAQEFDKKSKFQAQFSKGDNDSTPRVSSFSEQRSGIYL